MENRIGKFRDGGRDTKKDKLNAWFLEHNMGESEIDTLLEQILAQRKDVRLVRACAKKAGLHIERFITNKGLALYFDVYRGKRSMGYISKGWDDQGFRIGDIIKMDKTMPHFKEKFYDIYKICSKELISVHVSEKNTNPILIDMEIGIYKEGFNSAVFKESINTLYETMRIIRLSLEF